MPKAIIHTATGEFRDPQGRFLVEGRSQGWTESGCPPPTDPDYSLIELPEGVVPDRAKDRWSGTEIVAKTAQQLSDAATARFAAQVHATSRQKDVLATCALIVRARGLAAWNNLSMQGKVDATLAEADVWKTIREFIDDRI